MVDRITAEHTALMDSIKVIYKLVEADNRIEPDAMEIALDEIQGEIEGNLFLFDKLGFLK